MRWRRKRLSISLPDTFKKEKKSVKMQARKGKAKQRRWLPGVPSSAPSTLQLLLMSPARAPQKVKSLAAEFFSKHYTFSVYLLPQNRKKELRKTVSNIQDPYPKRKAKYLGTDYFNICNRIKIKSAENEKGFKGCNLWCSQLTGKVDEQVLKALVLPQSAWKD